MPSKAAPEAPKSNTITDKLAKTSGKEHVASDQVTLKSRRTKKVKRSRKEKKRKSSQDGSDSGDIDIDFEDKCSDNEGVNS